jgi:hypothetical protein
MVRGRPTETCARQFGQATCRDHAATADRLNCLKTLTQMYLPSHGYEVRDSLLSPEE